MFATTDTNFVSTSACTACGATFPADRLVYGARGRVCVTCDADTTLAAQLNRATNHAIVLGPVVMIAAFAASFVSLVLPWTVGPVVWGAVGLACVYQSVAAMMTLVTGSRSPSGRPSGLKQGMLVGSAAMTALGGFALLGLSLLGFGALALGSFGV